VLIQLITDNEKDEQRRQFIWTQTENFIRNVPLHSIDTKTRDAFNIKFNEFKSFIYDLQTQ